MIEIIKLRVREIFSQRLAGLFCQDFLQCVKPVRERMKGKEPQA
jgi:hypothetical protein